MIAEACFVDGNYGGCIVSLAAGVEHGLRELCDGGLDDGLGKLISEASQAIKINQIEIDSLRNLNNYRNNMAHSKIDNLSDGLQIQHGFVVSDPRNQTEKEMVIHFAKESKVQEMLLGVREAIDDIFYRNPWEPKPTAAQS